jgi:hypothetical protein
MDCRTRAVNVSRQRAHEAESLVEHEKERNEKLGRNALTDLYYPGIHWSVGLGSLEKMKFAVPTILFIWRYWPLCFVLLSSARPGLFGWT